MTDAERDLAGDFMARAERQLEASQHDIDGGFIPQSVSSSYYSILYAVKALLATRGLQTNRHSAAIRLFGREFIATGMMDRGQSKTMSLLLERRLSADYDADPAFTEQMAEDYLAQARDFVTAASALLDEILADD